MCEFLRLGEREALLFLAILPSGKVFQHFSNPHALQNPFFSIVYAFQRTLQKG